MKIKKYLFEEELIQGLIKYIPNRFIMFVEINGKIEKCHCPSTGKIGNIEFTDIPCLLSKAKANSQRKTNYTVEAISPKNKLWIGINQVKVNSYVKFFLENNLLSNIINVKEIKREVKLNNSKIDFFINNNCFFEVKTFLREIPFGKKKEKKKSVFFERLSRHIQEISMQINENQRAVLLLCNLYDADKFKVPENPNEEIKNIVQKATLNGLEHWQLNLKIDKKGVSLKNYFKLNLF